MIHGYTGETWHENEPPRTVYRVTGPEGERVRYVPDDLSLTPEERTEAALWAMDEALYDLMGMFTGLGGAGWWQGHRWAS